MFSSKLIAVFTALSLGISAFAAPVSDSTAVDVPEPVQVTSVSETISILRSGVGPILSQITTVTTTVHTDVSVQLVPLLTEINVKIGVAVTTLSSLNGRPIPEITAGPGPDVQLTDHQIAALIAPVISDITTVLDRVAVLELDASITDLIHTIVGTIGGLLHAVDTLLSGVVALVGSLLGSVLFTLENLGLRSILGGLGLGGVLSALGL